MLLDAENTFSQNQVVTATAVSQNVIDVGERRDIAVGAPIYVMIAITEAFTDAGSDSTLTVTVETDDNEAFGSPAVAQTLVLLPALTPISIAFFPLNPTTGMERFLRLNYTVAGGNLTTGKVTAVLTDTAIIWRAYAQSLLGPTG